VNKLIVGMIAVAGLAGMANAQSIQLSNGHWSTTDSAGNVVEIALIADGILNLAPGAAAAAAAALAGASEFNAAASAITAGDIRKVGITLLVRNRRAAGNNFGTAGIGNASATTSPTVAARPSFFSHNDTVGSWTGSLQRGSVSAGDDNNIGTTRFGAVGRNRSSVWYSPLAGETDIASAPGVGGNAWNSPTGNPVAGFGSFPGNVSVAASASTNAAINLASLSTGRIAGGFIDQSGAGGTTQIRGFDASVGATSASLLVGGGSLNSLQEFSGWNVLYRAWFVPRDNPVGLDERRQVTITAGGRPLFASTASPANVNFTKAAALNSNSAIAVGSVSFFVPTPGAAALLGLGGVVAFRRRRSA